MTSVHARSNRFQFSVNQIVRLDSERAQIDGKSLNRRLPVLNLPRGRDSWSVFFANAVVRVLRPDPVYSGREIGDLLKGVQETDLYEKDFPHLVLMFSIIRMYMIDLVFNWSATAGSKDSDVSITLLD